MSLYVKTCPKFLGILAAFYDAAPHVQPPDAQLVDALEMPQPYRRLLVHHSDMTSTLEAFHGEKIELRVLERIVSDDRMARHIVLQTKRNRRPVEYGAIRIDLGTLPEGAREEVLQCRNPLGGILNRHGVAHESCPGGFFRIESNGLIGRALRLDGPRTLYGRCSCLTDAEGRPIAEVVEVLPPEEPA